MRNVNRRSLHNDGLFEDATTISNDQAMRLMRNTSSCLHIETLDLWLTTQRIIALVCMESAAGVQPCLGLVLTQLLERIRHAGYHIAQLNRER